MSSFKTAAAVVPAGMLAFTLKVGDGEGWTITKLNRPRHFTYWREPALRAVLSTSPWNVESIDQVVGLTDDWLYARERGSTAHAARCDV